MRLICRGSLSGSGENMDWNIRIETPRLILREYVEADWSAVHAYASDAEVVRFMTWGPNTEEDSRNFVMALIEQQKMQPRKVFDLAVQTKADGRLIGSCGFRVALTVSEGASRTASKTGSEPAGEDPLAYVRERHASMGYCFNRDAWGQGYATEAATGVLRFGFEQLGFHKIFATCDVENKASVRVLERIGMRREGHMLEDIKVKAIWRDSFLYAMLNADWNPLE